MSGGRACRCGEHLKPITERRWRVLQRHCNHSAFNGGHYTPSDYSSIVCLNDDCTGCWRTKAAYVSRLRDATDEERGITR